MPINPGRAAQGGDVEGTKRIYVTQGEAFPVSAASFDPGYVLDATLSDADTTFAKADLMRGFCSYGKPVGE